MKKTKWEDRELSFLIENVGLLTHQEIADRLGRTKGAVQTKSNKLGLVKSKYTYNSGFFEEIDTEEKAYWLGFIYADGYIIFNERTRNYELGIELQIKDSTHLEKFNKALDGNISISSRKRVCNLNNKEYETCLIRIYNKRMVQSLMNYGVVQNKSKKISLPALRTDLMTHFVRGFFDGDGCITLDSQHNHPKADFTSGSLLFLQDLRAWLYENGVGSYICQEREETFRLFIRGMKNYDNFYNLIYEDSTIYLDRKKNKKEEIYRQYNVALRLPR